MRSRALDSSRAGRVISFYPHATIRSLTAPPIYTVLLSRGTPGSPPSGVPSRSTVHGPRHGGEIRGVSFTQNGCHPGDPQASSGSGRGSAASLSLHLSTRGRRHFRRG